MSGSTHLRGIVIAGALAAVAVALGFVTLAMNQTASRASASPRVLPLKHHHAAVASRSPKAPAVTKKKVVPKVDPNFAAAAAAGLPADVARALAANPVAVVELSSSSDSVAELAAAEAKSGAALAGAAFVEVDVDSDGGPVEKLTRALGTLPTAPASLVYVRPAKVFVTLDGFNDRTIVQQAVADARAAASAGAGGGAADADPSALGKGAA